MNLTKPALRSVRTQLGMLAIAYAGAVHLAIVAVCLRSVFFEAYVREKHPPVPEALLAEVRAGAARRLSQEELNLVYGAWMDDPGIDPRGDVARDLLSADGPTILARVRRTLVAGSLAQRLQAVRLLALTSSEELKPEAIQLGQYARERARRRGEQGLAERADLALHQLESSPNSPRREVNDDERR